ncbi:hypothetical protein EON65_58970 [archaeon]|nr:MAG: hypothetical protein EON65_58970 [archaeon]
MPEILQFAQEKMCDAPDFIVQLQHACIKQSNMYAGSKVVLQINAKATSLLHFFDCVVIKPENKKAVQGVLEALQEKFHTKDQPIGEAGFFGSMTMSLDREHRFQKLEMEADFFLSN